MTFTTGPATENIVSQRRLSALMSLYEDNYLRMARLLPGNRPPDHGCVSRAPGDLDLHLSVLARSRYTTTYHLTYYFPDGEGGRQADPDLHVRVYRDARMAETVYCGRNQHCRVLRSFQPASGSWLQRRWQLNLMLNKWLAYCLGKGHRFRVSEA